MKNLLAILVVLLSFGSMAQVKIGFVDTQKLLDTMPSRKVAIEKIVAYEAELMEEIKAMDAEVQKLIADYQNNGGRTPVLQQALQKKITEKQAQLEQRYESAQQDMQAYGNELNAPILEKMQKAIAIVAERQKLAMVVDKTSTLFNAAEMNITKEVAVELIKLETVK